MLLLAKRIGFQIQTFIFILSSTTASAFTVGDDIYTYTVNTNRISKTEFKQNQIFTTKKGLP